LGTRGKGEGDRPGAGDLNISWRDYETVRITNPTLQEKGDVVKGKSRKQGKTQIEEVREKRKKNCPKKTFQ